MARRQYGSGSVYQRADGKWVGTFDAGYTQSGGRRRLTVLANTQAAARRRLRERQEEYARGDTSARAPSLKAWAEEWLKISERTARPKSHGTDLGAVNKWIIPTIGHRRLDQLNPADVRRLVQAITDDGKSTTTAKRYVATLRVMLKAAVQEGHKVNANVIAMKPPVESVHDRTALPLASAAAVLREAKAMPDGSRWVAALLQGMRQGECLGLTWDQVDLENARLTISWQLQSLPYVDRRDKRKGFRIPDGYEVRRLQGSWHLVRPKSKAGWRTIPLVPGFVERLREWQEVAPKSKHRLVWPAEDGSPRSPASDREQWRQVQAAAGVAHPSERFYLLHEARHATATILMELGVPESVRIAIMGHSRISTTRGYEHVEEAMARTALEQVAGRLQIA